MTTAQFVETSVTVNNNGPIQDYIHSDDYTQSTCAFQQVTNGLNYFGVVELKAQYFSQSQYEIWNRHFCSSMPA